MAKSRTNRANRKKYERFRNCLLFWLCCGRKIQIEDDDEDDHQSVVDVLTSDTMEKPADAQNDTETVQVPRKRHAPSPPKTPTQERHDIKPLVRAAGIDIESALKLDGSNNDSGEADAIDAPRKRRAPSPPKPSIPEGADNEQCMHGDARKYNGQVDGNDDGIDNKAEPMLSPSDVKLDVSKVPVNRIDNSELTATANVDKDYPENLNSFGDDDDDDDNDAEDTEDANDICNGGGGDGDDAITKDVDDTKEFAIEDTADNGTNGVRKTEGSSGKPIDDYPEELNPFADDDDDGDDSNEMING